MKWKGFLTRWSRKRNPKPLPSAIVDPKEGVVVQIRSLATKEWRAKKLEKIDDQALEERMNALFPMVFEQQAESKAVYEISIPLQAKAPSETKEGKKAKRSRFGLRGLPSLKGIEKWAVPAGFSLASFHNSVMGFASFVVGQYYFAQIRERLNDIDRALAQIATFQNNEFKSKAFALLVQVKRSASFRYEMLDNPSLRKEEAHKFDALEQECMELLGQANLMIHSSIEEKDLSYAAYEEKTKEVENWYRYSQLLWGVLCQIAEGKYLCHEGKISLAYCQTVLVDYAPQCRQTYQALIAWHEENEKRLKIDVAKKRRERSGDPKSLWKWVPIKSYVALDATFLSCLEDQLSAPKELSFKAQEVFDHDVSFVVKAGEIYYEVESEKEK